MFPKCSNYQKNCVPASQTGHQQREPKALSTEKRRCHCRLGQRFWLDGTCVRRSEVEVLRALTAGAEDRRYAQIFRFTLQNHNRMCL